MTMSPMELLPAEPERSQLTRRPRLRRHRASVRTCIFQLYRDVEGGSRNAITGPRTGRLSMMPGGAGPSSGRSSCDENVRARQLAVLRLARHRRPILRMRREDLDPILFAENGVLALCAGDRWVPREPLV